MNQNKNLDVQGDNLDTEQVEQVDLEKSLDDNLAAMNTLLKAKKKEYSEDEINEMMKNKKAKEYMKKKMKENEEDENEEDEEEMTKKSFSDEDVELLDAVPFLKSFEKKLDSAVKKIKEISETITELQKSFDENNDLQKSFCGVLTSQSELIKSINEEIETIGNTPAPVKGLINQKDLYKSILGDNNSEGLKITSTSPDKLKPILLKSFQDGEISSLSISKWEQSRYNLGVFSKEEIQKIESKL